MAELLVVDGRGLGEVGGRVCVGVRSVTVEVGCVLTSPVAWDRRAGLSGVAGVLSEWSAVSPPGVLWPLLCPARRFSPLTSRWSAVLASTWRCSFIFSCRTVSSRRPDPAAGAGAGPAEGGGGWTGEGTGADAGQGPPSADPVEGPWPASRSRGDEIGFRGPPAA